MRSITGNTADKRASIDSLLLGLALELQNHHLQQRNRVLLSLKTLGNKVHQTINETKEAAF